MMRKPLIERVLVWLEDLPHVVRVMLALAVIILVALALPAGKAGAENEAAKLTREQLARCAAEGGCVTVSMKRLEEMGTEIAVVAYMQGLTDGSQTSCRRGPAT